MPIGASRLGFWFVPSSPPDPEDPVEQFTNLGFEEGISGWTVAATRIRFNGLSLLAGFPTPTDPDPQGAGAGDAIVVNTMPTFRYLLNTVDKPPLGQVQSMHLIMGDPQEGQVNAFGALYGPAIYSNFYVNFNAGDQVAFDWRARPLSDAYTVFAYMIEKDTGNVINLLRSWGQSSSSGTSWTTTTVNVTTTGAYKFVFVAGSWDRTGGTIIGGEMLIDNIRRIQP
jgi:plastocyanin